MPSRDRSHRYRQRPRDQRSGGAGHRADALSDAVSKTFEADSYSTRQPSDDFRPHESPTVRGDRSLHRDRHDDDDHGRHHHCHHHDRSERDRRRTNKRSRYEGEERGQLRDSHNNGAVPSSSTSANAETSSPRSAPASSRSSPHLRAQEAAAHTTASGDVSTLERVSAPSGHSIALEVKLRELLKAIAPTQADYARKMRVLRDVRRALCQVGLRVDVYGSLSTGLLIPSSDIDCTLSPLGDSSTADESGGYSSSSANAGPMPSRLERAMQNLANAHVMSTKERKACLSGGVWVVANAVRASRCFRNVLAIAHAKVPIVKCEHKHEDVKVDLSFEKDGIVSSQFLCQEFQKPGNELARPLIVLVKTMIAHWGLDDPSTGGLGSFPTSIMALWFLKAEVQTHYPVELRDSLAVLLVGFLRCFGCDFDYTRSGIDYVEGCTFSKPPANDLFIVNPVKPGTSCAKAATLYASKVVPCFAQAAKVLSESLDTHASEAKVEAALDRFFHGAVPDCRDWRLIRRRVSQYRLGPPNQWDAETRIYTGGVL